MASHHPPSPPLPPPTTISALTDDLLREIFLRLPDLPSLVRGASTCHPFLRAVRTSRAFRRRFRELHAPPLLALLRTPNMRAFFPASGRTSEPDIAAAFSDLLRDDDASEWGTNSQIRIPFSGGYVAFVNRKTEQIACYNPLNIGAPTQALHIYPKKPTRTYLEFHTLPPDQEEQRPSRVVCVHHERSWAWARVSVFSSHSMEWQIFPESGTLPMVQISMGNQQADGTVVNGFICWVHKREGCILALNTATFQFSRMDLPPPLRVPHTRFELGQTKDGKLCVVSTNLCSIHECMLSVWLWTADDDGVDKFVLHKMRPLHTTVNKVTKLSVQDYVPGELMKVIDGFVYLSVVLSSDTKSSEWFLSFCLETGEANLLFKKTRRLYCHVDPYIMPWPDSLICIKEDSETKVTGDSAGDDGCVGTKEGSPILFTALRSFKEALIDDDNTKFAEMDAFLLNDEINSLLRRISTLDTGLAAARDHILRIRPTGEEPRGMLLRRNPARVRIPGNSVPTGLEPGSPGVPLQPPTTRLSPGSHSDLRIGAHSDIYMEGMERESWWGMCKGMLQRARSRYFAS